MDTGSKASSILSPQSALREFAAGYIGEDVLTLYPEAKILPDYIRRHFRSAELVLDLGFGGGLWFWASFLPSLKRLDGIDLYAEALREADKVFAGDQVPAGFRLAHASIGERYTRSRLEELRLKRGRFFFQDYRSTWPEEIRRSRYDLVTEHGGGLADVCGESEFIEVVRKSAEVLKPLGFMLFANFRFKHPADLADCPERSGHVPLEADLYATAADAAGLTLVDLHVLERPPDMPAVQAFVYGFARKPGR